MFPMVYSVHSRLSLQCAEVSLRVVVSGETGEGSFWNKFEFRETSYGLECWVNEFSRRKVVKEEEMGRLRRHRVLGEPHLRRGAGAK